MSQKFEFGGSNLTEAIKATFERRGTSIPHDRPIAFTEEFYTNPDKQLQWQAFLRTSKLEDAKLHLPEVVKDIEKFLLPPLKALASNDSFTKKWISGVTWE